jgi:hypothetical protein
MNSSRNFISRKGMTGGVRSRSPVDAASENQMLGGSIKRRAAAAPAKNLSRTFNTREPNTVALGQVTRQFLKKVTAMQYANRQNGLGTITPMIKSLIVLLCECCSHGNYVSQPCHDLGFSTTSGNPTPGKCRLLRSGASTPNLLVGFFQPEPRSPTPSLSPTPGRFPTPQG